MHRDIWSLSKYYIAGFREKSFPVSIPNARQPPCVCSQGKELKLHTNTKRVLHRLDQNHEASLVCEQHGAETNTKMPSVKSFPPDYYGNASISTQTIQQTLQRIYPPNPIVYLGIVRRCAEQRFTDRNTNLQHKRLVEASRKDETDDGGFFVRSDERRDATRGKEGEEDVWVLQQGSCFGASRPPFVVFPIVPRRCQHGLEPSSQFQTSSLLALTRTNELTAYESSSMLLRHGSEQDKKSLLCLSNSLNSNGAGEMTKSHLEETEGRDVCFLSDLLQYIFSPVVEDPLSPYLKGIPTHMGVGPSKMGNISEKKGDRDGCFVRDLCGHQSIYGSASYSSITPASYAEVRQGRVAVEAQRLQELAMTTLHQRVPCLVLVDEREPVPFSDSVRNVEGSPRGRGIDVCGLGKPWKRVRFQVEPKSWRWNHDKKTDGGILPTVSLPTTSFEVSMYTERVLVQSLVPRGASHSALLNVLSNSQQRLNESRGLHGVDARDIVQLNTAAYNAENATISSPKGSPQTVWVWNGSFWVEEVDPQLSRVAREIFNQDQADCLFQDTGDKKKHSAPSALLRQPIAWVPSFWLDFRTYNSKPCFTHTYRMHPTHTFTEPMLQFTIELRKVWTVTGLEGIRQLLLMGSLCLKDVEEENETDGHRLASVDENHSASEMVVNSEKPPHDTQRFRKYSKQMQIAEKMLTVASLSSASSPPTLSSALSSEDVGVNFMPSVCPYNEAEGAMDLEIDGDSLFVSPTASHPYPSGSFLFDSSGAGFSRSRYPIYNALTGMPLPYNYIKSRHVRHKGSNLRNDVDQTTRSCSNGSTKPLHSSESAAARCLEYSTDHLDPFEYSFVSQQICWVPQSAVKDVRLLITGDQHDLEKHAFEQPRVRALVDFDEPLTSATAALRHEVYYTGFPFHQLPPWITCLIPSVDILIDDSKVTASAATGVRPLFKPASQETLLRTLLEHAPSPVSGCIQWHCNSDRKTRTKDPDDATVWVLQFDPAHFGIHARNPEPSLFSPVQGLLWRVYRVADTKVNFIFPMLDLLQSVDAKEKVHHGRCGWDRHSLETEVTLIRNLLHSVFEARCQMRRRPYEALRLGSELEAASYFFLDVRAALLLLEVLKAQKGATPSPARAHFTKINDINTVKGGMHCIGAQRGRSSVPADAETPPNRTADQNWLNEYEAMWSEHSSTQAQRKEAHQPNSAGPIVASFEKGSTRWFLSPSHFVEYCVTRCKQQVFWPLEELDAVLSLADLEEIAQDTPTAMSGPDKADVFTADAVSSGPLLQAASVPLEEAFLAQFEIRREGDDDDDEADEEHYEAAAKYDTTQPMEENARGCCGVGVDEGLPRRKDFPAVDRRYYRPGARLEAALQHPHNARKGRAAPRRQAREKAQFASLAGCGSVGEGGNAVGALVADTSGVGEACLPRHLRGSQIETCLAEEQRRMQRRWSPWLELLSKSIKGNPSRDDEKSTDTYNELPLSVPLSPLARMLCTLDEAKPAQTGSREACEKLIQDGGGSMEDVVPNETDPNGLRKGLCCWDLGLTVISVSYNEYYVNASNLSL